MCNVLFRNYIGCVINKIASKYSNITTAFLNEIFDFFISPKYSDNKQSSLDTFKELRHSHAIDNRCRCCS